MIAKVQRKASYQDILDAPENKVAELIDGELVLSPRPASPHARASSALGGSVGNAFDFGSGPGGWWILDEAELHFGADVLVPDLAGWRRERMPIIRNVPFFTLAPDWVCEVVSPSTRRFDRVRKLPIYLRERVGFVWLVDPLCKTVEAYQHNGEHWVVLGVWSEEQTARIPPFDAVELDLTLWWLPEEGEAAASSAEEPEPGLGDEQ